MRQRPMIPDRFSQCFMGIKPEALRLVATDINRLVIKDLKVDANREESF